MYAAKRDPTDEDGKEKILPRKSQAVYLSAYNVLNLWQEENKTTSFSEDTILAYFHEKAKVWKPSTLWGQFSMLKNVIMTNHNIDMGNYFKLIAFMKKQSKGYLPTKNKVFTTEEIQKFLNDAPDHEYLVMKVVAIFGMSGSCRCDEYSTITLDHINKQGKIYVVDITKSRKRQFTIDAKFHNIINRYHSLRPVKTTTNRFFLKYLYGKCYTQPIGINNFMRMPKHIATYLELSQASSYTAFSFPRSTAKILIEPIVKVITLRRHVRRKSSIDTDDYIIDSIKIERDIPPSPTFQVKSVPSSSGNVKRIKLEEENYCVITVKDNETQQPAKNMPSEIKFNPTLTVSDPQYNPVLIIGQLRHLTLLKFDDIRCKLEPRVSEKTFNEGVSCLHPSPTDTCPLFMDLATIAALPLKSSRHNTNSRAHAITKLVKTKTASINESIVIVCERSDIFASACAVVRAYPLYSQKTYDGAVSNNTIHPILEVKRGTSIVFVEFVVIEKNGSVSKESLSIDSINCLEEAARGIRLAARIVDTPCNQMNVSTFIDEIQIISKELCINATIIRGEELAAKGFGGIYGVGKAATVPPALVVLSHEVQGATDTVAWVGKGIVYDTGGLSIKGKSSMPGMKRDCGGAAAILGAFYAAVKCGYKQNLHAIFCLAENSVGPLATRPDDIHTLYSGRTVEINNTDAEGRLVLADGVVYAQRDLKANIILDMATLTGAQGIATGKYHGAILSNNEDWESKSLCAGRVSGDLLAPIVYCPELHFSEFSSALADMKNSVSDRHNAQSSCAGLFIASHIGFDFPGVWVHVDMASPVHCGERATGYGVALLLALFGKNTSSVMLQELLDVDYELPPKRKCY